MISRFSDFDSTALQTVREDRFLINRYDSWLIDEISPFIGSRIIEVGCGLGNLFKHFSNKELVVGIDPSIEAVDGANRLFANSPNIQVRHFDITDPTVLSLSDLRFDTAISLNVFEHIENDDLALQNISQLLQPNGSFIMIVPAHRQLYGDMDRSIGHYRRYTKAILAEKIERAGFTVFSQKYINILGAVGWWINGTVLRKTLPPKGQLRLMNLMIPLLRVVERHINSPVGISLITVANKD